MEGIAVSSGSACTSGSLESSHVLKAIGRTADLAHGSVRFSFGKFNTAEEVDYALEKFIKIVSRLRKISPLC
jgi:cysteine desulfurase